MSQLTRGALSEAPTAFSYARGQTRVWEFWVFFDYLFYAARLFLMGPQRFPLLQTSFPRPLHFEEPLVLPPLPPPNLRLAAVGCATFMHGKVCTLSDCCPVCSAPRNAQGSFLFFLKFITYYGVLPMGCVLTADHAIYPVCP